jgi:hypothetical protein
VKWTIKAYYPFSPRLERKTLSSAEAWDRLRIDLDAEAFSIPADRNSWIGFCSRNPHAANGAREIGEMVLAKGLSTVFSVGVGTGCIEYHLKSQFPQIRLICTEYSPRVVHRLRAIFIECDCLELFDIRSTDWPRADEKTLHFLHRVDTELDDDHWRIVFGNMASSRVERILVVASGFLTAKTLIEQYLRRWGSVLGHPLTFTGYLRTKEMFKTLWVPYYVVEEEYPVGGLTGFLLRRLQKV